MDDNTRNEARDYAWKYFQFHAEQRLKTFNFYLIIATVLSGGLFSILTNDTFPYKQWCSLLGFLLFFISFIFWRLERRNRQLVDNGEMALKHLDSQWNLSDEHKSLEIFERDNEAMEYIHFIPKVGIRLRYSICFNLVYFTFGIFGFVIGFMMLFFIT